MFPGLLYLESIQITQINEINLVNIFFFFLFYRAKVLVWAQKNHCGRQTEKPWRSAKSR